jgi:hypothetical protein
MFFNTTTSLALAILLVLPVRASADAHGPPINTMLAVSGVTALATTAVMPLFAYAADDTRTFPLLKGYLVTALGASLGAVLGFLVVYAEGKPGGVLLPMIGGPLVLGTAAMMVVLKQSREDVPPPDSDSSTRGSAPSILPRRFLLFRQPDGCAAVLTWEL